MNIKHYLQVAALGLITLIVGCGQNTTSETETQETNKAVLVKTTVVKPEKISRTIDFTASLAPWEEVHIAPASPGRIEKINVDISDNVSEGQILAMMDRTNLEQAKINLTSIETDYNRVEELKKSGSIADQQYDQVKKGYQLAKTSYEFLLENTKIKAPFSGVVSGKYFEDGEIYTGAPSPLIGKPAIISLIQINQLKALVGVSANYFPVIKKGMKAIVECDIYPDVTFNAEVNKIYPTIDNATKTFTVELKINNSNLKLRPGMFSKIRLDVGVGDAILVPTIALVKQTGTNDMYLFVNRNNVAHRQLVKTGRMLDDKTEIVEGINVGDEIVTIGQNKLEHLSEIEIME
ncbi:MAG TPA: efflux RND transporter periplasmic adaptor subunit [Salinivirgaceae bacterium]|nr:efflux RND transporter periplasmic adaptor subunit [Salinivirgaceae bacterium]